MPITSPGVRVVLLLLAGLAAGALSAQSPAEPKTDRAAAAAATAATPAEKAAAEAAEFDALLARLTAPLQLAPVTAAVRHPRVADAEVAQGLVVHLIVHKGMPAVHGLLTLANHADAKVREEAVRGVATLGLRAEVVADGVRARVHDSEPEVHAAAIAALGAVGEAGDVTGLIELLRSEEATERAVAFRALRWLTGVRLANDFKAWSYWWKHAGRDLGRRVDEAILRLTEGGTEVQLGDARQVLGRLAWFAPRRLEQVALEWLRGDDARLRIEALRLVAGARLGSLSDEVVTALYFEREPEVLQAGDECAVALAIRVIPGPDAAAPPAGR